MITRRHLLGALAGAMLPVGTRRIWLIGDSVGCLMMPHLVAEARVSGLGLAGNPVAGSSVIQWARQLDPELGAMRGYRPDAVLVMLGSNDACMGERVVRNETPFLLELIRKIRRPIIWLGPPRTGGPGRLERAIAGLEAFSRIIRQQDVPYIDARLIDVPMWDDLLHPTVEGRRIWAAWAWPQIVEPCPLGDGG